MVEHLLQYSIVIKIFLNTLLVSIPEEFYLVLVVLIFAGEFEQWRDKDCKKLFEGYDWFRLAVPTVVSALLSDIFRYNGILSTWALLLPPILLFILVILTNDPLRGIGKEWLGFASLGYLFAMISLFAVEIIYVPLFLYATGMTVLQMNNNVGLNFIVSIPQKLLLYSILVFFVIKQRTLLKANIIKPIFETKVTAFLTFLMMIFDLTFMDVMNKAICYEKVLYNIPFGMRIIVVSGICLFPIVNLSALIWGFYIIKNKETQKQKDEAEKLNNLLVGLNAYTADGKYDNIEWKLNEIRQELEKVSANLYKEGKKVDKTTRRKQKQEGIKE